MPKMVLNRNACITAGMAYIVFQKNIPQEIHPTHVQAAMSLGALPCDEADKKAVQAAVAVTAANAEPSNTTRMSDIVAAIQKLSERNQPGDYTAGGAPHAKRLQEFTGGEITGAERDEAWDRFRAAKRETA